MGKLAVFGSLNMDISVELNSLPKLGETIHGEGVRYLVGGKGANQAVAASRVGCDVTMLGNIGDDAFSDTILKELKKESIDLQHINRNLNTEAGIAIVNKLPEDNCITVIGGANQYSNQEYLNQVSNIVSSASTLLVQLETPLEAVGAALKFAFENQTLTILNPAPYTKGIIKYIEYVDIITPNESEFEALCNDSDVIADTIFEKMIRWQSKYATRLIVTLGGRGVAYVDDGKIKMIESIKVKVNDTTGAGDTFNGVLAALLSINMDFQESVAYACTAASISIEKFGAQTGMPTLNEVKNRNKYNLSN